MKTADIDRPPAAPDTSAASGRSFTKTTVNLSVGLLEEARVLAREEGTTLRDLLESGLRRELALRRRSSPAFELRDGSFRGRGVREGVDTGDWDQMLRLAYGERGG